MDKALGDGRSIAPRNRTRAQRARVDIDGGRDALPSRHPDLAPTTTAGWEASDLDKEGVEDNGETPDPPESEANGEEELAEAGGRLFGPSRSNKGEGKPEKNNGEGCCEERGGPAIAAPVGAARR